MNIPESRSENCQYITYDVLGNDVKMNAEEIRFHAVHGKPQTNGATPARPRSIIARFAVVREDRDAVFKVKNRLKFSARYGEAYFSQTTMQKERKTLIQSMFAAKQAGHDARVVPGGGVLFYMGYIGMCGPKG